MSDIPPGWVQRSDGTGAHGAGDRLSRWSAFPYSRQCRCRLARPVVPAVGGAICFINLFTVLVLVGAGAARAAGSVG